MIVKDFLFALLVATLLTALFAGAFRRTGPWGTVLWFFVVVLLAAWAGGVWARPAGPAMVGVYWLPFVTVGLLVALLLAAAAAPRPPRTPQEAAERIPESDEAAAAAVALSWFFWILVLALGVPILIHYLLQ